MCVHQKLRDAQRDQTSPGVNNSPSYTSEAWTNFIYSSNVWCFPQRALKKMAGSLVLTRTQGKNPQLSRAPLHSPLPSSLSLPLVRAMGFVYVRTSEVQPLLMSTATSSITHLEGSRWPQPVTPVSFLPPTPPLIRNP